MSRKLPPESYFSHSGKEIDFIFIEELDGEPNGVEVKKKTFSDQFEEAMKEEGLLVEKQTVNRLIVVKIHAPLERLLLQAELEGIELGVLPCDLPKPERYWFWRLIPCVTDPFKLPNSLRIKVDGYFTKPYVNNNKHEFIIPDEPFTPAQRKFLVQRILQDVFIPCDELKGGYNYLNLLEKKVYEEAFIPHDCDLVPNFGDEDTLSPPESWPQRQYLAYTWATWRRAFKYQPLDQIRSYFGEQVAFYFAWLGFYTKLLCLPSAMGVVVLIISSQLAKNDAVTFCSPEERFVPFCRSCASTACPFRGAGDLCMSAYISKIFEHPFSQLFSLFMTVWSGVMLDKWEQYQNTLAQRWSVNAIETYAVEKIRPQYRSNVDSERMNLVTLQTEPHLSTRSALVRFLSSASTVLFFICIVLALILATIVYKQNAHIIMEWTHWFSYMDEHGLQRFIIPPNLFTTITSSCMTVAIMAIMGRVYTKLAYWLTQLELPRTQQDFDNSYTYKLVVFQFVNYYGTVAYLALIRPFVKHNPLSEHNTDVCPPQGCMYDLVFQLLVIMIFKQAVNNVVEFSMPRIKRCVAKLATRKMPPDQQDVSNSSIPVEVGLSKPDDPQLLPDHMELLIQFGYVVMFAGVMPLLPLFALFNNILEIRIDADKYVSQTRRLCPTRVRNIQPWLVMLRTLSRAAIFTNAFIFAFTTSFPGALMVYMDPSVLQTNISHVWHVNVSPYTITMTFPLTSNVTSYTAMFDWRFRFRPFESLKTCYEYNEETRKVNDQILAEPLPPSIEDIEQWLDIPLLNMTELSLQLHKPQFEAMGGFFNDSLFMVQCRGGVIFETGYQIDQVMVDYVTGRLEAVTSGWILKNNSFVKALENNKTSAVINRSTSTFRHVWKRLENMAADGHNEHLARELDDLKWYAQHAFQGRVWKSCWANFDIALVNNTLVTSRDYYHVRYIQYTCAVAFILIASILQAVSQYLVSEHSVMDRVHEQRKHFVFRQHKLKTDLRVDDGDELTNAKQMRRIQRRAQSCEAIDESQLQRLID